jgi:hypothetical protein
LRVVFAKLGRISAARRLMLLPGAIDVTSPDGRGRERSEQVRGIAWRRIVSRLPVIRPFTVTPSQEQIACRIGHLDAVRVCD